MNEEIFSILWNTKSLASLKSFCREYPHISLDIKRFENDNDLVKSIYDKYEQYRKIISDYIFPIREM